ncbi:MAG: hypothetical protein A3B38_04535 [Candidatus Levybacteria bacterium RIFCSPLOWO2_01_FULL_36_13]|nr:MAG: hypothetical protein A2684_00285 [Candidatus Levybacteria bacterium RIFCSPHIGHO2_01_FULL_36_15b]OGH34096.1 MAG: hypothetical protein A3B38_04535 [Candidatus Levybacteria bacterium RIFCSPLOWO2_01_FULL_36_13]
MDFSIEQVITTSWKTLKKNPKNIIGFFLLIGVISILNLAISSQLGSIISNIESWIFGALVQVAIVTFTVSAFNKRKTTISSRLKDYKSVLKLIIGNFLSGVVIFLGFLALIIPGIVFAVRLQFVGFLIVEKQLGPIEAIKGSWKLTKNNFFTLLGFGIVSMLLNIFGFFLLIVGLLVTVPLTSLAQANVYLKLSEK